MQLNALLQALYAQQGASPSDPYSQNSGYASPVPYRNYLTQLSPSQESSFQQWVARNHVPFDPSQSADYDMRGFYQALMSGDPRAKRSINQNDGKLHSPDVWKTPYHDSFSAESQYARPGAPSWNALSQLRTPQGVVMYDEPAVVAKRTQVPYR